MISTAGASCDMIPGETGTLNSERTSMDFPNGSQVLKGTSLFQSGRAHEAEASHRPKSECASQVRAPTLQAWCIKHKENVPASVDKVELVFLFPLTSFANLLHLSAHAVNVSVNMVSDRCKCIHRDQQLVNSEVTNMTQGQRTRYVSRPSLSVREWIDLPLRMLIWGESIDTKCNGGLTVH